MMSDKIANLVLIAMIAGLLTPAVMLLAFWLSPPKSRLDDLFPWRREDPDQKERMRLLQRKEPTLGG
jgi:hypothetical protein